MTDPLLDTLAAALGIPLRPEWHASIRTNLDTSLRLATLVADFTLDDGTEMAPVFQA